MRNTVRHCDGSTGFSIDSHDNDAICSRTLQCSSPVPSRRKLHRHSWILSPACSIVAGTNEEILRIVQLHERIRQCWTANPIHNDRDRGARRCLEEIRVSLPRLSNRALFLRGDLLFASLAHVELDRIVGAARFQPRKEPARSCCIRLPVVSTSQIPVESLLRQRLVDEKCIRPADFRVVPEAAVILPQRCPIHSDQF